MPIIFLWIFKGCLNRVVATLVAMMAIFIIIETFDKSRYLGNGMTWSLLIEYMVLKAPFMITEFMPVIVLVATSIQLVQLSQHQELVALRAAGLGINKLITPILTVALLAAAVSFAFSEWVAPITNQRLDTIERVNIRQEPPVQHGQQWLHDANRFYRITPLQGDRFAMMVLQTNSSGGWTERMDAAWAQYRNGQWQLHDVYVSSPQGKEGTTLKHEDSIVLPSAIGPETADLPKPGHLHLLELNRYVNELQKAGLNADTYRYTLQRKLAVPLACLFMALLAGALCLHISTRSRASSWGLVAAISLGMLYYLSGTASALLGSSGQIPAGYAAWLPNLVFGGLALFLLLQREGH